MKCVIFKINTFFSTLWEKKWLHDFLAKSPQSFSAKNFHKTREFFLIKACHIKELETQKETDLRIQEFIEKYGTSWRQKISEEYVGCSGWHKIVVIGGNYYSLRSNGLTPSEISDVQSSGVGEIKYAKRQESERLQKKAKKRNFISKMKGENPSQGCWKAWTRGMFHGNDLVHEIEVWASSEQEARKLVKKKTNASITSISRVSH
jgi:hypothetical protein